MFAGNITYLNELLEKHLPEAGNTTDLRGFEWYHWWKAAHAHASQDGSAQENARPPLYGIDISPDYRLSAVRVWQFGTIVQSAAANHPEIARIRETPCLAFSPDGGKLVLAGNPLSLFDTATWQQQDLPFPGGGQMTCLAFSRGQHLMASGGGETGIILWGTENWELLGEPLPADETVRSLAFTRNGGKLIAAMDDSTVVVWDLAARTVVRTLTAHGNSVQSVAYSPVDDLFVTGSSDETVRLWNGEFELIGTYDAYAPVRHLKFSRDGKN